MNNIHKKRKRTLVVLSDLENREFVERYFLSLIVLLAENYCSYLQASRNLIIILPELVF